MITNLEEINSNIEIAENKKLNAKITKKSEINLLKNSHLNITNINEETDFILNIEENSEANIFIIDLTNNLENNIIVNLVGKDAKVTINTRTYTDKNQEKKFNIKINHLNKYTKSNVINYGVATEESQITVDITSNIKKGNNRSEAYQNTRIISLNDEAKAILNPILEIKEFDVKGGHSATFSKITDDEIYYLKSRGFTKDEAINLITVNTLMSGTKEDLENLIIRRINNEEL